MLGSRGVAWRTCTFNPYGSIHAQFRICTTHYRILVELTRYPGIRDDS